MSVVAESALGEITAPRWRGGVTVHVVEPDQVFVLTELRQFILLGRAYRAVAPFIDGVHSVADVLSAASAMVSEPEALFALHQLRHKGYIVNAVPDAAGEPEWAWAGALGMAWPEAVRRREATGIALRVIGEVPIDALVSALRRTGISVADSREPHAAPTVVVTSDYLHPDLAATADALGSAGVPWLLVKAGGQLSWIGPLFTPGEGPCWHCLASRLRGNRQVERYVERHAQGADTVSYAVRTTTAWSRSSLTATAALLAPLVERWMLDGALPLLTGVVRTYDLVSWQSAAHQVVRRPQCAHCGDASWSDPNRAPAPIALVSRPKLATHDGGHRGERPEQTLRRLLRHVSPITGIVSSLVRKDATENGLTYSFAAGHDFVHEGRDPSALRGNLRFRSGGKGMTETQSRVSAIAESIERWAGIWRNDEPRRRSTQDALGETAIDLPTVLGFSHAQYAHRAAWNAQCSPTHYHVVPHRFDPTRELDWTPMHSLRSGALRYLPSAYCWYGHPESRVFFCASDANGTAAGNSLEEAILQGFLELAERDAVAIWWYNRVSRPGVDLNSFHDPYIAALQAHYATLRRELWVLDLTHDLGIPTFAAISRRIDGAAEDILASFGAHWDPRIALTRALTETNQFLPAVASRNADGTTRYAYDDPDALRWWREATIATEPYLAPSPSLAATRLSDFAHVPRHSDLRDDVQACLDVAERAGLDVFVLDQTRPDVDLRVVRVVVPGLRHFWRRLAPGRLFDVPVTLGWLHEPVAESAMNPTSMFF